MSGGFFISLCFGVNLEISAHTTFVLGIICREKSVANKQSDRRKGSSV